MPGMPSERTLIAFLELGRWHSPSRKRRRNINDEEDKAFEPASRQQERGLMERAEVGTKVSHAFTNLSFAIRSMLIGW